MDFSYDELNDNDAYGAYYISLYNNEGKKYIVERDDGYVNTGSLQYDEGYSDWHQVEQKAMEFVNGKVLDIGAGMGRHSLYLKNAGYEVYPIDLSKIAVKICKNKGLKNASCTDMWNIEKNFENINTFLMLGNNFGLVGNPEDAVKFLNKLGQVTSKNGKILAGTINPYATKELEHSEYHFKNFKEGKMGGQLKIRIRFLDYIGDWHNLLLVSPEEMKEILKETSWSLDNIIGEPNKGRYISVLR